MSRLTTYACIDSIFVSIIAALNVFTLFLYSSLPVPPCLLLSLCVSVPICFLSASFCTVPVFVSLCACLLPAPSPCLPACACLSCLPSLLFLLFVYYLCLCVFIGLDLIVSPVCLSFFLYCPCLDLFANIPVSPFAYICLVDSFSVSLSLCLCLLVHDCFLP